MGGRPRRTSTSSCSLPLPLLVLLALGAIGAAALLLLAPSLPAPPATPGAENGDATAAVRRAEQHVEVAAVSSTVAPDLPALRTRVQELREEVLRIKRSLAPGHFMETDPTALDATRRLQEASRDLLVAQHGPGPYRVALQLEFPASMPGDRHASIEIELAPLELMPHAVHVFMDAMVDGFQGAAFHRAAPHVLQVQVSGQHQGLAFQEYSAAFPHELGTLGFAGRPGGPAFYISILDNVRNHGPGSQQSANPYEADACFGKVVKGWDDIVMRRMRHQPGAQDANGFLRGAENNIWIKAVTLLA
eukprot:TRINITY_DN10139_c0_g2_i1.p1 TRINITY_DN10139_c0_g2~~TRINITY_DN10139_c0_g2_i1.p1  ORF type:complete len:324 (+),score=37.89 TRINITY_DN10139_c0_g2_i1:63-974(+)